MMDGREFDLRFPDVLSEAAHTLHVLAPRAHSERCPGHGHDVDGVMPGVLLDFGGKECPRCAAACSAARLERANLELVVRDRRGREVRVLDFVRITADGADVLGQVTSIAITAGSIGTVRHDVYVWEFHQPRRFLGDCAPEDLLYVSPGDVPW